MNHRAWQDERRLRQPASHVLAVNSPNQALISLLIGFVWGTPGRPFHLGRLRQRQLRLVPNSKARLDATRGFAPQLAARSP